MVQEKRVRLSGDGLGCVLNEMGGWNVKRMVGNDG